MDTEAIERSCKYLSQLFLHTIENMKAGFSVWKDFTYKAAKLHVALKSICQAVSGFLEAFQKVADLATNAKGATKEIGVALTRLCLRHRNIEKKLDHATHTFESSLINPVEEKLEDWKKIVFQIEKDHTRDSKKATRDYKKISLQTEKLEKKNKKDANLLKEIATLSLEKKEKLVALESIEKSSVRSALLEERRRHCHMILAMKPFVDAEMTLLSDLMHLEEIISSLMKQAQDPQTLPNSSEQVILDITSQTIPEGWSCQQPTKSFPTPSESLLSLSSVYSHSNRSSIVSDFDDQSVNNDVNLNASLSSLPVSLIRNHRSGGSVPPPLDRGHRNGRPLFRQSLYNPSLMSGSQSSSTSGITYLQQQQQNQQERQKQLEHNSRILFPSTSAPSTPEAKLQTEYGHQAQAKVGTSSFSQQKVIGKPPTFPPSYLRRKGSFGKALQLSQSNISFSSSPTSSILSSFQTSWADSDRPRSLAVSGAQHNQIARNLSEQMGRGLVPPVSQNHSLSSSSTLKDDEEREEENEKMLNLVNECLNNVSDANESAIGSQLNQLDPTDLLVQHHNVVVATSSSLVPPSLPTPAKTSHAPSGQMTFVDQRVSRQLMTGVPQGSQLRNNYASPNIMSPRRSLPTGQSHRSPYAMPPQQIIDGYKIQSGSMSESTPSPKSVNYVDFHALPSCSAVFTPPSSGKQATNQVFINLEKTGPPQTVFYSGQLHHASPIHVNSRAQVYITKAGAQQNYTQLEREPHAYGIVSGKPSPSAAYNQHFQKKVIAYPSQPPQHEIRTNHLHLSSSPPQIQYTNNQQGSIGHLNRGSISPSIRRLPPPPPPPLPANLDNLTEKGPDSQFCPWTLRANSSDADRSNSATPTNDINNAAYPQENLGLVSSFPSTSDRCISEDSRADTVQQLPKGFVKHWENSV